MTEWFSTIVKHIYYSLSIQVVVLELLFLLLLLLIILLLLLVKVRLIISFYSWTWVFWLDLLSNLHFIFIWFRMLIFKSLNLLYLIFLFFSVFFTNNFILYLLLSVFLGQVKLIRKNLLLFSKRLMFRTVIFLFLRIMIRFIHISKRLLTLLCFISIQTLLVQKVFPFFIKSVCLLLLYLLDMGYICVL